MLSITEENVYAWDLHNGEEKWKDNVQKTFGEITSSFYGLIYSFLYFPISL